VSAKEYNVKVTFCGAVWGETCFIVIEMFWKPAVLQSTLLVLLNAAITLFVFEASICRLVLPKILEYPDELVGGAPNPAR
jgi:hypothetical protein